MSSQKPLDGPTDRRPQQAGSPNKVSGNSTTHITAGVIRRVSKVVADMVTTLRNQRDMLLTQRDLTLPPEPLDNLKAFGEDLNNLLNRLTDNQVELQQLNELARTTQVINSGRNLDHVLNDVIDTVIALTGAERGYIVLKEGAAGELQFRVARKLQQSDLNDQEFIVSRTIVERVAITGEPIVTFNAQEDDRLAGADSVFDYMLRSILCVPLKAKGRVIGVIYVDNRWRQALFGEREQRVVFAFANQAAIAIENTRLFEQVRANIAEITRINDFMDAVFASIASGVVTTDRHDLITAFNAAAARILDISAEASIGQSLWSVLPPLYDGFKELVEDVRTRDLQQVVEAEPVLEKRGQVMLNLKLSPFKDAQQATQGVAMVLDDLTELTQRQSQLSALRRYLSPQMLDNIQEIDELQLTGVEREISLVHCDVRGFTTFSEQLQPEELMTVINEYLSVSSEAIYRFEGIIDKYMGDAALGMFNTQLNPQADHALRAVRAALAMVEGVQALYDRLPPRQRLMYGIGVHSGPAILGNVGSPRRKEFTAIGNTIQFAKLLQESSSDNAVIVSQETYLLVRDHIAAQMLPPRKLADQQDFIVTYRVTGLR
jgi:PAS domain S-box-containing protein